MNIQKLRRSVLLTVLAATATLVVACTDAAEVKPPSPPTPSPASSPSPLASPSASPASADKGKADALLGRWPGVEGSYLNVTKKGEKYSIEIANLDGPKIFEGTVKDRMIEFTRDGKTETIKTATGSETGMKGFEKETTCVVVTKGSEGYCRK